MVLHRPRNSAENRQPLVVASDSLSSILPLTTISLIQFFISKIRPLSLLNRIKVAWRPICSNPASTLSLVQAARNLFRKANTLLRVFFSIFLSLVLQRVSMGSDLIENFNGPETVATVAPAPGLRVLEQRIGDIDTTGQSCETIVLQTDRTTLGQILFVIPESAIIDEFLATVRLRCDQPSVRLACQIVLPSIQGQDGQAVRIYVSGSPSTISSRWQSLTIENIPSVLRSQLPALRAQYGPQFTLDGATISGLAVEIPLGIGRCNVSIDAVSVTGIITATQPRKVATSPPSMLLQQNIQSITKATTTENAGLVRGVLEVDGKPFFPRAIEHRGEPFIKLAQLGFNCVQLYEPASTTLLAEAEQAGVWITVSYTHLTLPTRYRV